MKQLKMKIVNGKATLVSGGGGGEKGKKKKGLKTAKKATHSQKASRSSPLKKGGGKLPRPSPLAASTPENDPDQVSEKKKNQLFSLGEHNT